MGAMMRVLMMAVAAAASLFGGGALAEPTGVWWAGFGQGNFEYAIKNDSAGSDEFYVSCGEVPTTIRVRVGGVDPQAGQTSVVTIGAAEYELFTGPGGEFETKSHVGSDTFHALWDAIRGGQVMRVRLATGQSTVFTLKGAAKALPKESCPTDFER